MQSTFDAALIASTAGVILSLLFNYIPGLNAKFDSLSSDAQRGVMGLVILATAFGMALWQCSSGSSAFSTSDLCTDGLNWRLVLTNAVFALIGNQSTDRISPKPRSSETAQKTSVRSVPETNIADPGKTRFVDPSRRVE